MVKEGRFIIILLNTIIGLDVKTKRKSMVDLSILFVNTIYKH